MRKNKDIEKESTSIIKEIESQLEDLLTKKKEEIEKGLEERIRKEKEDAKRKINQVEKEFKEEKEALTNYRNTVAEFENNKGNLKSQIKEHLEKAIQFQTQIEALTAQTLEELKKVRDLSQKLEELHQRAQETTTVLKKDLEDRFGIVTEALKADELEEVDFDLDKELSRLKKIKELLKTPESIKHKKVKPEPEEEARLEEPQMEEVREEKGVSKMESESELQVDTQEVEETVEAAEAEEGKPSEEEPSPEEEVEVAGLEEERTFQDTFEILDTFRKSEGTEDNGEVSFFEHNEKIVIDGEGLVSALNDSVVEAKKLFIKLTQTESPKDQFFIKQEIIKHQETLRKLVLRSVRMCEKESCSLPRYTLDILNIDVLKDILEKLSMENWSNQDDFASFNEYAKELKDAYYALITPPVAYLKSLIKELEIE